MADMMTKKQRSRCMSKIRSKDTKPEMIIRRLIFSLGYRYRLHFKDLPGKPDIVFTKKRKVIFVHGCFWHMHDCKRGQSEPKTNPEFWSKKRRRNFDRDRINLEKLNEEGWKVLVIWECEMKDMDRLKDIITNFLDH